MIYGTYTIGGELMHAHTREWSKPTKYIEKKKTKTGKWRYIYPDTYKNDGKRYYKIAKARSNQRKGVKLGLMPENKTNDFDYLYKLLKDIDYKESNAEELGPKFKEIDDMLDKKVDPNISLDDYDKLLAKTVNEKYGTNYSGSGIRSIIDDYEDRHKKEKK